MLQVRRAVSSSPRRVLPRCHFLNNLCQEGSVWFTFPTESAARQPQGQQCAWRSCQAVEWSDHPWEAQRAVGEARGSGVQASAWLREGVQGGMCSPSLAAVLQALPPMVRRGPCALSSTPLGCGWDCGGLGELAGSLFN